MNRTALTMSHWGAFRARVIDGRLAEVLPFEHDPRPSALNDAWLDMLDSPLRVSRPSVRRGWIERDGGAGRGDDPFIEIGWDEALDRVADEIGRVRSEHGNLSLFAGSYGWSSAGRIHHARTLVRRFFATLGGFTDQYSNYSYGAAQAFLPHVVGVDTAIGAAVTSAASIARECDIVLALGGIPLKNWEVTSGGFGEHRYDAFVEMLHRRARVINVSPFRGDMGPGSRSEWLPIRPNTDTALLLALTRAVIRDGGHDRAFLATHCEGFETFAAYLAGEADGIEKGPDWAADITGIPAASIEGIARSLPGRRVLVAANWSLQRARHGEQPYWASVALAGVLGQIGLPGGGFAFGLGSANGMGNPRYETPQAGLSTIQAREVLEIPVARMADLLLQPGETCRFNGTTITYPDIRLVYWAGGNPFHHHQDLNRLRQAFHRPETVIVHENFWTSTARHADIVLPATTPLERNDIGGTSRDPWLVAMPKLVEPRAEARNDYDIFAALAARLGVREAFTEGRDEAGWLRWSWDRIRTGLAARGIPAPGLEEFWDQGYLKMPEPPAEAEYVMFADFREDPVANALPTPSGRIELFSATVAAAGLPGHPAWLDPEEWLGAPLAGRWPLHLLTPQPARRLHGQMDWSRHSQAGKRHGREVVQMHPDDAAARDIREGDVVRLFNDRGSCLAVAGIEPGLMRGVVLLPTGATYDPDGLSDRNSNPNVLTRDIGTSELGQGCSAQSCLVEIVRFDDPLPPLRVMSPPDFVASPEAHRTAQP